MSFMPPWSILPPEIQDVLYSREVPVDKIVECQYWFERDRFRVVVRMKLERPAPNLAAAMYTPSTPIERVEIIDTVELGRGP